MKKDIFSMENKTVVFTGGCGYLGKAMVKALLDYGANVAVLDRADSFDESFDVCKQKGKLAVIPADLKKTEDIKRSFAKAEEIFGKLDVLVNCANYGGGANGKAAEYRLDKVDDETWEGTIDGALNVNFRCTREMIPYFDKTGGGVIVNIGSMYGIISPDFEIYGDNEPWNPPAYGAGKAGVLQFTRYCAAALAGRNIRVNSISPGPFPNAAAYTANREFIGRLSKKTMMKRVGRSDELVGAILLLCSDASSFMTGANVVVDGGMTQW